MLVNRKQNYLSIFSINFYTIARQADLDIRMTAVDEFSTLSVCSLENFSGECTNAMPI